MDVIVLAFVHAAQITRLPLRSPSLPSPDNHTRATEKRTMNCLAFLGPLADVACNCPRCHLSASAAFTPRLFLPVGSSCADVCPYVWTLAATQRQTRKKTAHRCHTTLHLSQGSAGNTSALVAGGACRSLNTTQAHSLGHLQDVRVQQADSGTLHTDTPSCYLLPSGNVRGCSSWIIKLQIACSPDKD